MDFINENDKILIVAPHPDDETIGCGGLLALYGKQCDILLLTDGRKGYRAEDAVDENELALSREAELNKAAAAASANEVFCLHLPDGKLKENAERVKTFDITKYSKIFVPNRYEKHKDHCCVLGIFRGMKKQQKASAVFYEYEVWSPLSNPETILDISPVMDKKIEMIGKYKSQLKYVDYTALTIGLSQYRGAGSTVAYAEAFSRVEELSFAKKIYRKLPLKIRKFIHRIIG